MQRSKQATGDKRRLLNIHAVARDLRVDVNLALTCSPARIYWLRYYQRVHTKWESDAPETP